MIASPPDSCELFIPLERNLPSDRPESLPLAARRIPSSVDVRQELFDQGSTDGRMLCPGCLRLFGREYLDLLDVDHIVPKIRSGRRCWDNVQLLCRTCNSAKGTMPNTSFLVRKTLGEWQDSIREAGRRATLSGDHHDGDGAYSVDLQFFLRPTSTDGAYPEFKVVDLFTLTLDALEGVIWKRRCQVTSSTIGKHFTNHAVSQGLRIDIARLT